jgi:hypothetical protein
MEMIYEVHRWGSFRWHATRTKLCEDWFGHSSNIKVTTSTIWEAVVLVLLMGGTYDVCRSDDLRRHDIHTEFLDDHFKYASNIKWITLTIWKSIVLVLLMREFVMYAVEMPSYGMTYFPSSWRFVQAFKKYYGFSSTIWMVVMLVLLMEWNYVVRRWDWLRWHGIWIKFYEDWYRCSRNIKVLPQQFQRR